MPGDRWRIEGFRGFRTNKKNNRGFYNPSSNDQQIATVFLVGCKQHVPRHAHAASLLLLALFQLTSVSVAARQQREHTQNREVDGGSLPDTPETGEGMPTYRTTRCEVVDSG